MHQEGEGTWVGVPGAAPASPINPQCESMGSESIFTKRQSLKCARYKGQPPGSLSSTRTPSAAAPLASETPTLNQGHLVKRTNEPASRPMGALRCRTRCRITSEPGRLCPLLPRGHVARPRDILSGTPIVSPAHTARPGQPEGALTRTVYRSRPRDRSSCGLSGQGCQVKWRLALVLIARLGSRRRPSMNGPSRVGRTRVPPSQPSTG